ncbi:MAG: hypothetical protein JRG85_13150 [Deltaproteobacteria bacterium]|nr:hypothetical protein [Deltaproteobacteria bacterium]
MKTTIALVLALALGARFAAPAHADAQPTARDIQAAVDDYLAQAQSDANLVGGAADAGYDQGFWIRSGDFTLKFNATLQTRYEAWVWDDSQKPLLGEGANVQGHGSGFSLPRATLKLSGTAPCTLRYYVELEFGHFGRDRLDIGLDGPLTDPLGPSAQSFNFDSTREAWIQWGRSDAFKVRIGQIRTATTRQAMVVPELQQFVDVSLATAFVGWTMPGYTDRNRDHGFGVHGTIGCDRRWSYLVTVTNGDGADSIRNVLDTRTSDNLAYSGRLTWAFANPIGWQEGALRQHTCLWYGELGAWGYYYADRVDRAHATVTDAVRYGADLALGYSGWSLTAAYNGGRDENAAGGSVDYTAYLVQLGYHFKGTAWELAARYDAYDNEQGTPPFGGGPQQLPFATSGSVREFAFGVNYYLNGHGNRLSLDVSFVEGSDAGSAFLGDLLAGYPGVGANGAGQGAETYGTLVRFQWQLAL